MVLLPKQWKSRSSPGFAGGAQGTHSHFLPDGETGFDAGWSSPVARQAHNLKVVGSNPTPATNPSPDPTVPLCPLPSMGDQFLNDIKYF